ncbi:peptide chain release factor N(5)-glutamine methyltransferase [Gammaproteobacteria bacterium LSUCC0112]|nr:peptide chain release factor N(5)-glutamine methyltransferase [Gammaproteobacteria bacterium LSUCC0112]
MLKTLQQAIDWAADTLHDLETPRVDAEWLLMHVLQCTRTRLLTHADQTLTKQQTVAFEQAIMRRHAGEPVAYITGTRGFWTLDLHVTPDVLIPRADTELLVEQALALADNQARLCVADLGTGSGAIALAIASERPNWQVLAVDSSAAALMLARKNARLNHLSHVEFYEGNWCEALPDNLLLDMVVSNPPYIDAADPHLLAGDLRFEPMSALRAAENGLSDLRTLSAQAYERLKPGGWALFEHGYNQGPAVQTLLQQSGFVGIRTIRDHGDQDRVTMGKKAEGSDHE